MTRRFILRSIHGTFLIRIKLLTLSIMADDYFKGYDLLAERSNHVKS